MEACYHGNLECVKVVVERGASWLTRDLSGQSLNSSHTATHLVHSLSLSGFSALHWAVDGGHIPVISYALHEGVPVGGPACDL